MSRTFALGRKRMPEGWIVYPYDVPYRRQHFIQESFQHPAKMNCFLLEDIVDYVSSPGETILDPMSGTGTLMLATLRPDGPRKVICIEDSALFHNYQQFSRDILLRLFNGPGEHGEGIGRHHLPISEQEKLITLLYGPCQDYLPLPCDHVIFSPPYASVLKAKAKAESTQSLMGTTWVHDAQAGTSVFDDYQGDSAKNLGRMPTFQYNMEMSRIYGLLLQSVRPGGTMTVVVQDMMKEGERVELTDWVMRTCVKQGWMMKDWFDRHAPGTGMKKSQKAKGHKVVENESIIVLEKPQ